MVLVSVLIRYLNTNNFIIPLKLLLVKFRESEVAIQAEKVVYTLLYFDRLLLRQGGNVGVKVQRTSAKAFALALVLYPP